MHPEYPNLPSGATIHAIEEGLIFWHDPRFEPEWGRGVDTPRAMVEVRYDHWGDEDTCGVCYRPSSTGTKGWRYQPTDDSPPPKRSHP